MLTETEGQVIERLARALIDALRDDLPEEDADQIASDIKLGNIRPVGELWDALDA